MKRITIGLLIGILLLSACGQSSPVPVFENATATPSLSPTHTPTVFITPLPTIPTFTPTFDVSTIVTVTPAPKDECPKEDPTLKPDLKVLFAQESLRSLKDQALLDFLNLGGTPNSVITSFLQEFVWFHANMGIQLDVTGDQVNEFLVTDQRFVYVFGCDNGKYKILLSDSDEPMWLQSISFNASHDMNLNGIPEIIIDEQGGHGLPTGRISIFEWNGSDFAPLIQSEAYNTNQYFPFADMSFSPDIFIADTDGNGTLELILKSNLPIPVSSQYAHLIPWRNETYIYSWNGVLFTLDRIEYTYPQYRFQALQDADNEISHRNYNKALLLYQDVITNDKLQTWSLSIEENEIAKSFAIRDNYPTPTPVPNDITEYPRLAAYAYYRIMLIHLVQNHESDATTIYNTLQEKFGNDQYGQPYVEMATVFWKAYQSTHKMYDGCAAAIQYAAEHPEILTPLGSDYHGSQSHIYKPEDVCPFR